MGEKSTRDTIKVGLHVFTAGEIEDALRDSAFIQEAAVVGAPHELLGQVPVAFVVTREGVKATSADLLSFCRHRLAAYKVPAAIVVRSNLPRNHVGDLDKSALQKEAADVLIELIADLR